jgi:D-arginine dehydrogenase
MNNSYDFIVIGGGICGAAAAYELSSHGSVALLERENQLAYHTTGRSAAISMESYGNAIIRRLTVWSTKFLKECTSEFSVDPLWSARGALILSDAENEVNLNRRIEAIQKLVPSVTKVDEQQLLKLAPYLRPDQWAAGLYEPNAFDLDVHAIHSAYVRGIKRRGGEIMRNCALSQATRKNGAWKVTLTNGDHLECGVIVNAAGAWADEVAGNCGVEQSGIRPLRRTVLLIDPNVAVPHTPYVGSVDEQIFIKPEATGFMVSPCDETLSAPCDAAPDEMDIAITMDRFLTMTNFERCDVRSKWAGLRIFVPDRTPLLGNDPDMPGFVWFAAVGGYGIQAGPAMAKICAASALGEGLPLEICGEEFAASDLSSKRYRAIPFSQAGVSSVAELC